MITAEDYHKLPVAKAITVVDLPRIDVHTQSAGAPVTVCTVEGVHYRVPEKMQGLAHRAFDAMARGCAPEVERGKLFDVLQAMAGEEEAKHSMTSVANALANKALEEFAAELRDAMLRKLEERRECVMQEVLSSLLE